MNLAFPEHIHESGRDNFEAIGAWLPIRDFERSSLRLTILLLGCCIPSLSTGEHLKSVSTKDS